MRLIAVYGGLFPFFGIISANGRIHSENISFLFRDAESRIGGGRDTQLPSVGVGVELPGAVGGDARTWLAAVDCHRIAGGGPGRTYLAVSCRGTAAGGEA